MAITPSHRGPSRRNRFLVALTFLLPVSALHVFINPYTKVEESFTIQAVHDILTYGLSTSALPRYDHHLFPGAVPRSFIGPILLSTAAYPRIWAARVLGWTTTSADIQTLVRWTLSDVYALSLSLFATAIFPSRSPYRTKAKNETGHSDQYARGTSAFYFFILLSCAQFHANFWGGRTVPNSIALPFVLLSLSFLSGASGLSQPHRSSQWRTRIAVTLLTFAATVLRLEIVGILIPVSLWVLFTRKLSFLDLVLTGLCAGTGSVLSTVLVDTYFWQPNAIQQTRGVVSCFLQAFKQRGRPMWPELEAMLFNVVEGKSSEWGVSPPYAYVTSHVPKLLSFSLPLLILGMATLVRSPRSRASLPARNLLSAIPAVHVSLLSCLGHKEWRFIVYCVPCLNAISAIAAASLLNARIWILRLVPAMVLLLTASTTLLATYISHLNYPGGVALSLLHAQVPSHPAARVHIEVLPAMTGVTLFQSIHTHWEYEKTEKDIPWDTYTHILTDHPNCTGIPGPFRPISPPVAAYDTLRIKSPSQWLKQIRYARLKHIEPFLPFEIRMRNAVWVCERV